MPIPYSWYKISKKKIFWSSNGGPIGCYEISVKTLSIEIVYLTHLMVFANTKLERVSGHKAGEVRGM